MATAADIDLTPPEPLLAPEVVRYLHENFDRIRGLLVQPDWTIIGDSGAPAFENSWVNFGGGHAVAAFLKDNQNMVVIKGLVKTGTPVSTVFTLPTGYRPAEKLIISSIAQGSAIAQINIDIDGTVDVNVGSSTWTSLNAITFKADA